MSNNWKYEKYFENFYISVQYFHEEYVEKIALLLKTIPKKLIFENGVKLFDSVLKNMVAPEAWNGCSHWSGLFWAKVGQAQNTCYQA